MRKRCGEDTTWADASDSAAARNVDPGGIITRFSSVVLPPHALTPHARTARLRQRQRMLKQDSRGQGVNISFASLRGSTHLAHRPQCGCAGISFVNITHGQPGPLRELGANITNFGRPRGLLAVAVER